MSNKDILWVKMDIASRCSVLIDRLYSLKISYNDILKLVQDGGVPGVDIECRIAFRISKEVHKDPKLIANELAKELISDYYTVNDVNGYLNFTLTEKFYYEYLLEEIHRPARSGQRVIVEYPSVNPNKPLHIGHLRNAIIGDCISNILDYYGYDVVRMNYIDDLGLQVAQSFWMYKGSRMSAESKKFDHILGEEYVRAAKYYEEDPSVRKEVEDIMKKLEEGDPDVCSNEKDMCMKCVNSQNETLQRYGVYHNVLVWESDIVHAKLLEDCLNLLERRGILVSGSGKYAGCKIVELSAHPEFKGMEDADKVFVRANGVATYTAKDTAFAMWKFGLLNNKIMFREYSTQKNGSTLYTSCSYGKNIEYNKGDIVINVIGVEQEYPQKIIKTVLSLAGFNKQADNYIHISYGHVRLREGRFSGRKGTWKGYSADELADESVSKAYTLVSDRFKEYTEDEKKEIAEKVGIGAIRYAFMRITPEKELVFDWDKALNFEGDSGPYLQYSYARALHIIEKEGIDHGWKGNLVFSDQAEFSLIRTLARFGEIVNKSVKSYSPHIIADYVIQLCSDFNVFYSRCRVIGTEKDVSESRKRLVNRYLDIMKTCLNMLGIPIVEHM